MNPLALVLLLQVAALPLVVGPRVRYGVRYGAVMEPALHALDSAWTVDGPELAGCVTRWERRTTAGDYRPLIRVWEVTLLPAAPASVRDVDIDCPPGVPTFHAHRPNAYGFDDCDPSQRDQDRLVERADAFALIQCDRRAYRFHYPDGAME